MLRGIQQSQIIGLSRLLGGRGRKIVYIDNKEEGNQDRSLKYAVFHTSKPVSLAVTGGDGENFILDKLQDHPGHVLIWQES